MQSTSNPTQNLKAAEKAFLGSLMLDPAQITETAGIITGNMFTHPADETIYNAIIYTGTAFGTTDPIVVADYLTQTGEIAAIPDGVAYLHTLISAPSSPSLAPHYAQVIASAYQGRTLNTVMAEATDKLTQGIAPAQVLSLLTSKLTDLSFTQAGAPTALGESIPETVNALQDGLGGVPTGIRDFDEKWGGLGRGQLTFGAARPGMGKTVVGLKVARNVAKTGVPVLFFALEMSKMQLLTRVISAECRIPTDRLNLIRPKLTENDWEKINLNAQRILDMPLYVDADTRTIEGIIARVQGFVRKYPNALIVIDYLGLITSEKKNAREQEVLTDISKALKQLTLAGNIPIFCLAQLNRSSETRGDHVPQLSDLRGSGSMEQDADNVFLFYREDYYEPESPRAGELEIIGAKVRAGSTGTVAVAAQLHYMDIADMARG